MTETLNDRFYLSNRTGRFGASVILYPGLLKEISERMGGSFYIMPLSVHNLLIKKDGPEELGKILKESNMYVIHKDAVLSDSIYFYDSDTEVLRIV